MKQRIIAFDSGRRTSLARHPGVRPQTARPTRPAADYAHVGPYCRRPRRTPRPGARLQTVRRRNPNESLALGRLPQSMTETETREAVSLVTDRASVIQLKLEWHSRPLRLKDDEGKFSMT